MKNKNRRIPKNGMQRYAVKKKLIYFAPKKA